MVPWNIEVRYLGNFELTPKQQAKVIKRVLDALKEFPDFCEGSVWLGGIEYYFTYEVRSELVTTYLQPRVDAEKLLNQHGLSTHQWFNPLPEAKRPN
jgi:hypothetical protein